MVSALWRKSTSHLAMTIIFCRRFCTVTCSDCKPSAPDISRKVCRSSSVASPVWNLCRTWWKSCVPRRSSAETESTLGFELWPDPEERDDADDAGPQLLELDSDANGNLTGRRSVGYDQLWSDEQLMIACETSSNVLCCSGL